ncbi:FAS1-like dehydratase domain-containing protein [Dactylosporangium salmoneum]|uniref:FAS1-like dehydratase domain-containing protein n=1 Tax=Dactylosporangium salmoneum TaxID=53361 RepID=A0ABP5U883_9ACTN
MTDPWPGLDQPPEWQLPAAVTVEVTREAVHRFAIATGALSPLHHDVAEARAAGHPDLLAPRYFFVSLGLAMDQDRPRAELSQGGIALSDPLARHRVVAGETSVQWNGDIHAGDRIVITRTFIEQLHKEARSGPFDLYRFVRTYAKGDEVLVREHYARIAR